MIFVELCHSTRHSSTDVNLTASKQEMAITISIMTSSILKSNIIKSLLQNNMQIVIYVRNYPENSWLNRFSDVFWKIET